jgi:hypothetical protein
MNRLFLVAVLGATTLGLTTAAAPAQAAIINTTERGWYNSDGAHSPANDNYFTGSFAFGNELRSFFVFDLSSVSGTITAAQLQLYNPVYSSDNQNETLNLFDVTTSITSLTDGTGGVAAFNDLGTGTLLGTATVSAADNGQVVNINLNAAGLAVLNAAIGGQVAIGGALNLTPPQPFNRYVFAFSGSGDPADGSTRIDLTTGQVTPNAVPAPAGLVLGLLGVPALGLLRRRTAAA